MIDQKIVIIILAAALTAILTWFVLIDNYVIPAIISENQMSFQNGYDAGINDAILGIMQQNEQCRQVTVWSGNDTVRLIDVACLQPVADNSDITSP